MSEYLTRLSHFKFEKDGEQLVVTSERDSTFQEVFDIPEDLDVDDSQELFERYYTELYTKYQEFES